MNPNAEEVEGEPCFASVTAIPDGVDGVVVVTPPEVAESVVADCAAAGVQRVWLHRGLGPGSMSQQAVDACREHGIRVIPGACPNMFGATADATDACSRCCGSAGRSPGPCDRRPGPSGGA